MKKYFLSAIIMLLAYIPAHAQIVEPKDTYVVNGTGEWTAYGGIICEWSVGETIIDTGSVPGLIVTQGLLQPFVPVGATGINVRQIQANLISVYPNPAADVIYIQPKFAAGDMIALRLFDITGRLLLEKKADLKYGTERQELHIAHFPAGQFLLQVSNRAAASKSFQIQKIN